MVCWVGVRWRVCAGCRGPPADQLGPFPRFQRALRGQLASQLLEGAGVRDYRGLAREWGKAGMTTEATLVILGAQ